LVTAGGNWLADAGIHIERASEAVREAFGLTPGGASLGRPDGVIAWGKAAPDGVVSARAS
jgi:hypothetical protein